MKFKKEDLGLYFALGLVGAGAGLLVGAFVSSRLVGPSLVVEPLDLEGQTEELDEKITRVKKRPKKDQKEIPGLKEFVDRYSPTPMQVQMVMNGLITLPALEEILLKEEAEVIAEPYSYAKQYGEEKPDLVEPEEDEEKVDLGGVIDERYEILQDPPEGKSPKSQQIVYYDQEDDSFYTKTRTRRPIVATLKGKISPGTWEAMLPYMLGGYAPLWVDDLKTQKFYKFELIPQDLEVPSDVRDVSDG